MATERTGEEERGCPPALALERYLANAIDGTTSESWKSHIDGCETCRAALTQMSVDGARFAASRMYKTARARIAPSAWRRAWPVLAAAAAILLVFLARPKEWSSKGTVTFAVVAESGANGPFTAGSTVQMTVTSDAPGVACVLARESSGEVSVLFGPARVGAGAKVRLGESLVVEHRHDGTELWLFFEEGDLDIAALRAELERNDNRRVRARVRIDVLE